MLNKRIWKKDKIWKLTKILREKLPKTIKNNDFYQLFIKVKFMIIPKNTKLKMILYPLVKKTDNSDELKRERKKKAIKDLNPILNKIKSVSERLTISNESLIYFIKSLNKFLCTPRYLVFWTNIWVS